MSDEDEELDSEDEIEADADEEIGDDLSDDFDDAIAVDDDDDSVDNDSDEEEEAEVSIKPKTRGATRKKRAETEALHTVAAREDLRRQLANDVEAFLKRGGAIKSVAQDERADPPKKPESNYGRGSI